MSAKAIMTSPAITLKQDDLVSDAIRIMLKNNIHNLPVVDDDGYFLGLFGICNLVYSLLPDEAKLGRYSINNLNFIPDNPTQLNEHMCAVSKRSVSKFIFPQDLNCCCSPDTPIP